MMVCNGCGGVLGRDCFNAQECEQIAADMAMRATGDAYQDGFRDGHAAGLRDALSTLPTMTREELVEIIKEAEREHDEGDPQTFDSQWTRELHIASTILFRFPHILTPEPLVKVGESK